VFEREPKVDKTLRKIGEWRVTAGISAVRRRKCAKRWANLVVDNILGVPPRPQIAELRQSRSVCTVRIVMLREGGASSNHKGRDKYQSLVDTGSSAFADDDNFR